MTLSALQQAAYDALAAVPDLPPLVPPNRSSAAAGPRVEVSEGPVAGLTATMGGDDDVRWIMQAAIVMPENKGAGPLQAHVQCIVDAFPAGRPIGPGFVVQTPYPEAYIQDGTGYRAVLSIAFRALL